MDIPRRKTIRLKDYDYSKSGKYFITICTKNREMLLGSVGTGVLDGPSAGIRLTDYGIIAEKYILQLNSFYSNIDVDRYVIMPNHIHLLLSISEQENLVGNGPSRTPVPTQIQNSTVSKFISTFKRFCNKEYGKNIWQYRSNDHIVRNEEDYLRICEYIDNNPIKWLEDCFYAE